jgi:hypothetical protein
MLKAARNATTRFSIRARTAAVNGASRVTGPATMPRLGPKIGAESMAPRPDMAAATIQLSSERRRTGMPSSSARSVESATPRMATPKSVRANR